eukprot:3849340-Amphidinium_carterae.2
MPALAHGAQNAAKHQPPADSSSRVSRELLLCPRPCPCTHTTDICFHLTAQKHNVAHLGQTPTIALTSEVSAIMKHTSQVCILSGMSTAPTQL